MINAGNNCFLIISCIMLGGNMRIDQLKEPLAITMWDTAWIRRQYTGGGFESFDRTLNELVERGYNAVRIDPFPHMIANAPDGTNSDRFLDPSGFGNQQFGFTSWGGQWTVYTEPKKDIVRFIKKCEEKNIHVLLSTWLKPTIEPRNEWLNGPEDLIRIWDETIQYLTDQDCMKNVIGVDVSNEIPFYAGNKWLYDQLESIKTPGVLLNQAQKEYYAQYFKKVLRELRKRWPDIPFAASMEWNVFNCHRDFDFTEWEFLDLHLWAEMNREIDIWENVPWHEVTKMHVDVKCNFEFENAYVGLERVMPPDINFDKINNQILENWDKKKSLIAEWMEQEIASVAQRGKQYGIPVGNTEGWGAIFWREHPLLTWDFIKEAGIMAAKLGQKYGYTFNCQSNFCAPQFVSLWNDIEYHKEITSIIRRKNSGE